MRFRIAKDHNGQTYAIIVSGTLDDGGAWDILQIAQTMLSRPNCKELIIDLRPAEIDDDLTALNTEALASLFEESLMRKDSSLVVRFRDDSEIRLCSDQLPLMRLQPHPAFQFTEARYFGGIMPWFKQESRQLVH